MAVVPRRVFPTGLQAPAQRWACRFGSPHGLPVWFGPPRLACLVDDGQQVGYAGELQYSLYGSGFAEHGQTVRQGAPNGTPGPLDPTVARPPHREPRRSVAARLGSADPERHPRPCARRGVLEFETLFSASETATAMSSH